MISRDPLPGTGPEEPGRSREPAPMNEYQDKFGKIIDLLKERSPQGLSISAIARETDMNRASVSKYLDVLQSTGDVSMRQFGRAKIYTPAHRVPLSELFDQLLKCHRRPGCRSPDTYGEHELHQDPWRPPGEEYRRCFPLRPESPHIL
ncbi:MAG: winged helix-turn-helix domain-containing protein [Methanoculleus sp.]